MASRAKRKNNKSGSSRLSFLLCASCVPLSVVNHLTAHFPSPEREANLFVTQKWNNHAPFNITNGSFCTSKNVYFVSRVGRGDKKTNKDKLGDKTKTSVGYVYKSMGFYFVSPCREINVSRNNPPPQKNFLFFFTRVRFASYQVK
ncbi:Uncharacterized protein APZ42_002214 [Daphnia magna]|uniref:Uncharacterized protein n=1 Tax=Daphnia magna TaxID=35525 RepID=A0A0P5VB74_9CRUS|nr:Uncharacterized protein APZ42_002214 [Daphnia magna]